MSDPILVFLDHMTRIAMGRRGDALMTLLGDTGETRCPRPATHGKPMSADADIAFRLDQQDGAKPH